LTGTRRLERRDHVEDIGLVAVEAGDREPSGRVRRLLDDLGDLAVLDSRDTEVAEMFRLPDVGKQHAGAGPLPAEVADRRRDRTAEDIFREHDADPVPP